MPPDETSARRVPPHLRQLLVQQDYSRYTAIDQAVWRFVLLQTHERLKATAHPAYQRGLGQTGISVERIPSIAEMDEHLRPFGWGAVCVDGFIPPRAFQELQSLSILPIAADMRTAEHLVYTPAPDIIHEAAGHAPILPEPVYAEYLKRIGALGARAFTLPHDARVDRAIYALSELKEDRDATPERVAEAEQALLLARAEAREVSEATRLSRLYWWTAEYGLVGKPHDYKLYGAGLLSSLWESHACHDSSVAKLVLSAAVTGVDYDVTRPQPQLFVARDFEALHSTLDDVARELPSVQGGEASLRAALAAQEVATITLLGGVTLVGRLRWRLELSGQSALLELAGGARASLAPAAHDSDAVLAVLGDARRALGALPEHGPVELELAHGLRAQGTLRSSVRGQDGASALLVFESGTLVSTALARPLRAGSVLALAPGVLGAWAGAESSFYPETALPGLSVPRPRAPEAAERELLALYEQALSVLRGELGAKVVPVFERLHRGLQLHFKDDWLLRWNLLESLLELGINGALSATLWAELEALELRFEHRQPIASGLRYLSAEAARRAG